MNASGTTRHVSCFSANNNAAQRGHQLRVTRPRLGLLITAAGPPHGAMTASGGAPQGTLCILLCLRVVTFHFQPLYNYLNFSSPPTVEWNCYSTFFAAFLKLNWITNYNTIQKGVFCRIYLANLGENPVCINNKPPFQISFFSHPLSLLSNYLQFSLTNSGHTPWVFTPEDRPRRARHLNPKSNKLYGNFFVHLLFLFPSRRYYLNLTSPLFLLSAVGSYQRGLFSIFNRV